MAENSKNADSPIQAYVRKCGTGSLHLIMQEFLAQTPDFPQKQTFTEIWALHWEKLGPALESVADTMNWS